MNRHGLAFSLEGEGSDFEAADDLLSRDLAEVAFDNVQRSTRYPSGFALRFARIVRIRDDLGPEDAATVEDVRAVFERQSGVT